MAERATINQVTQWGVETVLGTEVNANKLMSALMVEMGPELESSRYRPSGGKFETIIVPNREWTGAGISGPITFTEIIYPLNSVLQKVTPTGAGTPKTWTMAPAQTQADTIASYTVEMGSAVRASLFTGAIVTALDLEFSTQGCELSGEMWGGAMQDGITMTATPTALALKPVLPKHVSVYLADTQAGLDAADPLLRVVSAGWSVGNRFGQVWVLNGATDPAAFVELPIDLGARLRLQADAEGMGLLTTMRTGATKFMRILAESEEEVDTGAPYMLQIDTAVKVADVSRFEDEEGQMVLQWDFGGVYDSVWGKATEATVVNALATL